MNKKTQKKVVLIPLLILIFLVYLTLTFIIMSFLNSKQEKKIQYNGFSFEGDFDLKDSIVTYDKERAYDGINVISIISPQKIDYNFEKTLLVDMEGNILYKWETNLKNVFKKLKKENDIIFNENSNHYLFRLLPGGDALVWVQNKGLVRIDKDSNIVWVIEDRVHHDFRFYDNHIYALVWEERYLDYKDQIVPILDEILVKYDYDGNFVGKESLHDILYSLIPDSTYDSIIAQMKEEGIYDAIQEKQGNHYLPGGKGKTWDIYHMNSIQFLEKEDHNVFNTGQLLVSMRTLSTIAVLDLEKKEIIWKYSGDIITQHNPTLLDNGNILLYDNGGNVEVDKIVIDDEVYERGLVRREYTRILEINPVSKSIVWEYYDNKNYDFFSEIMGNVQRFPNGNTLFPESTSGRIIEVTKDGEVVWEYIPPGNDTYLYRAYRLTPEEEEIYNKHVK